VYLWNIKPSLVRIIFYFQNEFHWGLPRRNGGGGGCFWWETQSTPTASWHFMLCPNPRVISLQEPSFGRKITKSNLEWILLNTLTFSCSGIWRETGLEWAEELGKEWTQTPSFQAYTEQLVEEKRKKKKLFTLQKLALHHHSYPSTNTSYNNIFINMGNTGY